jgi:hypothetical protein
MAIATSPSPSQGKPNGSSLRNNQNSKPNNSTGPHQRSPSAEKTAFCHSRTFDCMGKYTILRRFPFQTTSIKPKLGLSSNKDYGNEGIFRF